MELDLKALAAGLATAAFFSFAAHAHQEAAHEPDACSTTKSSAAEHCPSPSRKAG